MSINGIKIVVGLSSLHIATPSLKSTHNLGRTSRAGVRARHRINGRRAYGPSFQLWWDRPVLAAFPRENTHMVTKRRQIRAESLARAWQLLPDIDGPSWRIWGACHTHIQLSAPKARSAAINQTAKFKWLCQTGSSLFGSHLIFHIVGRHRPQDGSHDKAPDLADMLLNRVRTVLDIGALEICPLVFSSHINPIEMKKVKIICRYLHENHALYRYICRALPTWGTPKAKLTTLEKKTWTQR